jgi:hypothetical protein
MGKLIWTIEETILDFEIGLTDLGTKLAVLGLSFLWLATHM